MPVITTDWRNFAQESKSITRDGYVKAWDQPGWGTEEDGSSAAANPKNGYSTYLMSYGSKFGSAYGDLVPEYATILGVEVRIKKYQNSSSSPNTDSEVKLTLDGHIHSSAVGTNHASPDPINTTPLTWFYYGAADDMWGLAITAADVRGAGIGVMYSVSKAFNVANQAYVDVMQMRITYFAPVYETMQGGVKNGGSAGVTGSTNLRMQGGISGGGSAGVSHRMHEFGNAAPRILANGAATELTTHKFTGSGGMLVSSVAGDHATITPYWDTAQGGILTSPIAFVEPYHPTGGASAGGSAIYFEILDVAIEENEWASYMTGGEVVPPQTNSLWGRAYSWLDATTNEFGWYVELSFTDNVRYIRINGPADFGETANVQLRIGQLSGDDYSSPITGSTILTDEQKADLLAGLWYWEVQNWSLQTIRAQITHPTGLSLTGAILQTYGQFMEGGALGSSTQVEQVVYTPPVPIGGSLLNGEAIIAIQSLSSGVSLVGGSADVTATYAVAMTNGVVVIGDADESIIYEHPTLGGALAGGAGSIAIAPAISGGASVYGSHDFAFVAAPPVSGGVLATPDHVQTFTDFYDAEGGMRVGGRTIAERLRSYTSRHLNYGYAMGSENIFTRVIYQQSLIAPTDDEAPELSEDSFRIQHEPGWCDVEDKCEEGVLPKIVQRRQGQYLPPKNGRTTVHDRGITRVAL